MKEESLLLLSDLQKLINQVVLIDYTIIILGGDVMFDDDVREKIFAKSELQKIDLLTLSPVIKAIEEVLEENKDEHAVSATNDELYT